MNGLAYISPLIRLRAHFLPFHQITSVFGVDYRAQHYCPLQWREPAIDMQSSLQTTMVLLWRLRLGS